jgi:RNA polymerase-associated protein RTF1
VSIALDCQYFLLIMYSSSDGDAASEVDSQGSADMEESESDSDGPDNYDNDDGMSYPLEGKYRNETDRAELLGMSEIKREGILAERATVIEREQQNLALRRLLRQKEKDSGKAEKKQRRTAADFMDDEDKTRKSTREKKTLGGRREGEVSEKMQEYKRQREQRGINNEKRRLDDDGRRGAKKRGRRDGSDGYSDADASGESDVEWDDPKPASPPSGSRPASLSDLNHVLVARKHAAQFCFYPNFEQLITGCFARVTVGVHPVTKQNDYRMAKINGECSDSRVAGW